MRKLTNRSARHAIVSLSIGGTLWAIATTYAQAESCGRVCQLEKEVHMLINSATREKDTPGGFCSRLVEVTQLVRSYDTQRKLERKRWSDATLHFVLGYLGLCSTSKGAGSRDGEFSATWIGGGPAASSWEISKAINTVVRDTKLQEPGEQRNQSLDSAVQRLVQEKGRLSRFVFSPRELALRSSLSGKPCDSVSANNRDLCLRFRRWENDTY